MKETWIAYKIVEYWNREAKIAEAYAFSSRSEATRYANNRNKGSSVWTFRVKKIDTLTCPSG